MKNKYKLITRFIVLLSMITVRLGAQLSGAYTINSALATGGTNYQTFNAFATAINTGGVSGAVSVNVVANSGPYNEQVSFNNITGTSATNSVVINGNGNTISFAATSGAPHTLMLAGADFFTINNLVILGTGSSNALTFHVYNQSNNNTVNSCSISCNINVSSSAFVPVSFSGSGTSATTTGDCGNNNTVTSCTITGGYYNTMVYGFTSSPYTTGVKITNNKCRDFYAYGIYNYYSRAPIVTGNIVERPNQTVSGTTYGIYMSTMSDNALVEGNRCQKFFDNMPGNTNTSYVIYIGYSSTLGAETVVRNNVVSDMKQNTYIYGIYCPTINYVNIYHNTIVLDDQLSTAGSAYGIYANGNPMNIRNNLISCVRTGSGTKCCIYLYGASIVCNNNVLYQNSTGGTNAVGYYNAYFTTMQQWQSTGWDLNSIHANPIFAGAATQNYTPTNPVINNLGLALGVATDITGFARNLPAPDAGAFEFFNTNCTGTPSSNSVITPTNIVCSFNTSAIGLANTYTVNGLSYAWGTSTTSAFGPYTAIPGATVASINTTTLPISTFYTATITCAGFGSPLVTTAGQVTIATTVVGSIPYYENFEGISVNGELPNCSWLKNNSNASTYTTPQNSSRFPRSGNKFASVYGYNLNGTNYYYTNGLQMNAGVTYSASMWYTTEYYGYTNFTELSMLVGPNQGTTGLVNITTAAPALSPNYKELANIFTVPTTGIYYVAIKVVSTANNQYANYLSWDDLSITIPCQLNTPVVNVAASSSSICAGSVVNFTATGANSYVWNNGATTAALSDSPVNTTNYVVVGTNSVTNCSATVTKYVTVRQTPAVYIVSFNPNVCVGSSINLTATGGATSYTWNTGANTPILSVSPVNTTTYSVVGANTYGCTNTAAIQVNSLPLPTVNASTTPANTSCTGQMITLSATGTGVSYQWVSSNTFAQGASVQATAGSTAGLMTFTVTGTDANGCSKVATVDLTAFVCTGIASNRSSLVGLSVYPNPTTGSFNIELANGLDKTIQVTDVTGRMISTLTSSEDKVDMNIGALANGVYYVTVKSNNSVEVMKIVKQ